MKLNKRELQIIDSLIRQYTFHAERCDKLNNHKMAEKQKKWDLEKVALFVKIKKESGK